MSFKRLLAPVALAAAAHRRGGAGEVENVIVDGGDATPPP